VQGTVEGEFQSKAIKVLHTGSARLAVWMKGEIQCGNDAIFVVPSEATLRVPESELIRHLTEVIRDNHVGDKDLGVWRFSDCRLHVREPRFDFGGDHIDLTCEVRLFGQAGLSTAKLRPAEFVANVQLRTRWALGPARELTQQQVRLYVELREFKLTKVMLGDKLADAMTNHLIEQAVKGEKLEWFAPAFPNPEPVLRSLLDKVVVSKVTVTRDGDIVVVRAECQSRK
jgi:hypothetical protein